MRNTPPGSGFYNLLKPPGMTAHDVVAFARRRLGTSKVGHAGTLDPLATGVLPIAVGGFTRLLPYLEGGKSYRAEIAFGRSTTTADAAGETLAVGVPTFDEAALRAALLSFSGTLEQRPPAYSAVHVNGQRAYALAREGVAMELPTRQVVISRIELVRFEPHVALVDVDCSAGTYIRSLAVDLGETLGVPAHLSFLLRTQAGPFGLETATRLDDPWEPVPVNRALTSLHGFEVGQIEAADLRMGRAVATEAPHGLARAMCMGEIVAVGEVSQGSFRPKTVLPG